VLLLVLAQPRLLAAGRLGRHRYPSGAYLYVGSALGAGGLQARLRRHLSPGRRPRWHVDRLLAVARPRALFAVVSRTRLECRWARALVRAGALPAVPGFGASDCRCATHLFRWPEPPERIPAPPGGRLLRRYSIPR